jgi:replicative DNA helicase
MEPDHVIGRVPPHNAEAEKAVLGSLLIDPRRMADVVDQLRGDDFFDQRNGLIFEALLHLSDNGEPIDFISVSERLLAQQALERCGGRAYLLELTSTVSSSAHLKHHAGLVAQTSSLRRLITEATRIVEQAYATRPDGENVQELIDESEHAIFKVSDARGGGDADPIASVLKDTMRRIDSSTHRSGLVGLTTGFYDLDDMTAGWAGGQLIILAARPAMGKTAFALNLMDHAAASNPEWMEDGPPVVLFYSLEMGNQSVVSRMLCTRARVDAHKLKTGKIPSEDRFELARAADELSNLRLFIDDTPGLSVMSMRSRARRIKQREGGLHLVVVDYLQLMTHPKAESRQLEISAISRSLKELARELDCPVIALSQLSRAVESREDKRPQLSDLRESGSIEQDADVVLLLYRPEYYAPTEENRGKAEVLIAKQRNGPTGTVKLHFFGSQMRFENPAPSMVEAIDP